MRWLTVVLAVGGDARAQSRSREIASGKPKWRTSVDPARSDHMTRARDGRRLFVSA